MSKEPDFLTIVAAGYTTCGVTEPVDGLLLAVSGGADSTALLHSTLNLWPQHKGRIAVAHVDHKLRTESQQDRQHVEDMCESLGVECFSTEVSVTESQSKSGRSMEEVARHLRYDFFQKTATDQRMRFVVCAHHQDDQAETILHNIIRGTGLRGLAGMKPVRELSDGIRIVRPVLQATRDDVERFLMSEGLPWQMDGTNLSAEFTRNRIRHQILPLLRELNPQVDRSLARLSEQSAVTDSAIRSIASDSLQSALLERQPDICRIACETLQSLPAGLLPYVFLELWVQQEWSRQRMTAAHWGMLQQAVVTGTPSSANLPGQLRFEICNSMMRIFRG